MRIQSTKDIGADRLKILVYAPAGSGKTSLAKTIKEPTLIISAEAGLLVLRGYDIDVFDITLTDSGELIPKEQRFAKIAEAFKYIQTPEARAKYKWIFIDSLTEIAQNLIEGLKALHGDKNGLKLWGEYSDSMRGMIKAFRDLPYYNVVFTALSEREKDENGQHTVGVAMSGKIAQALPAYFDEVFYVVVNKDADGNEQRRLLTRGSESIPAKDRSGMLEQYEVPDLNIIANKIRGV